MENLEGNGEFAIAWPGEAGPLRWGRTAVMRVRNEARCLPWVMPSVLAAYDAVVLVDNGSDDGTPDLARKLADELDAGDRLTVRDYPFRVARAGEENLLAPARSVHSLTWFYNWSFAQSRTSYSFKWDGDMILTAEGVRVLRDLEWQLAPVHAIVAIPTHPLYVESDSVAWLDDGSAHLEAYGAPNRPEFRFLKAFEWETRDQPEWAERIELPYGICLELKFLDSDEFSHWTSPESFLDNPRAVRKQREWAIFEAVRAGRPGDIEGLRRVEAPAGTHVIQHVIDTNRSTASLSTTHRSTTHRPTPNLSTTETPDGAPGGVR